MLDILAGMVRKLDHRLERSCAVFLSACSLIITCSTYWPEWSEKEPGQETDTIFLFVISSCLRSQLIIKCSTYWLGWSKQWARPGDLHDSPVCADFLYAHSIRYQYIIYIHIGRDGQKLGRETFTILLSVVSSCLRYTLEQNSTTYIACNGRDTF
jgi:hypothetical protein